MRHNKTCKQTCTEIEECKKIIAEQKSQIEQMGNKKLSIKNTNTNTNTNSNNIINNTNNITYRLEFGNENLHERLTEKEKKNILEKMHTSLIEYIKLIHFSGAYPDCMNFFCSNLRSNHAQVYNEEQKKFITQFASDFFNNVIDTRLDEISTMFDEHKDKLEKIKIERLNKFFESMESTNDSKSKKYMETVADVKMLAYNNKHKFESQPSVITCDTLTK
jgi:small-conductance mechanosensitive channel